MSVMASPMGLLKAGQMKQAAVRNAVRLSAPFGAGVRRVAPTSSLLELVRAFGLGSFRAEILTRRLPVDATAAARLLTDAPLPPHFYSRTVQATSFGARSRTPCKQKADAVP